MSERAASRSDRLVRTLAILAGGPVSALLVTDDYSFAHALAGLAVAGSLQLSWVLPRRAAARLGRLGALFAASLVLAVVGAFIGVLDGCTGASRCRASVGAWTFSWMFLPLLLAAVFGLARFVCSVLVRVPVASYRIVSRVFSRLRRR